MTSSPSIYEGIFESSPDGIIIADSSGVIVRANRRIEELFGYPIAELAGCTVERLMPVQLRQRHAEYRSDYFANPRSRPMGAGLELHGVSSNGAQFPIDIMLSPIRIDGALMVMAVIRDITDRKNNERALKQSETLFQGLFEQAPDAIAVVDSVGAIVRVNSQFENAFGYNRSELLGEPIERLIPERYHRNHMHHRNGYFHGPRMRPMGAGLELFARRKDGSEFPVDIMLSPLQQDNEQYVLAVIRDVTERRLADEQRREAVRRETLLREIHHRLKNNLQVISSMLDLQSDTLQDPQIRAIFQESKNRIRSIALIHEKLYQSKTVGTFAFDQYIADLTTHLFHSYGIDPGTITLTVDAHDIAFNLDTAVPCALIVNELVANSLKHAFPDGREGRIEIALHRNGEKYLLRVSDNGIGLPEGFSYQSSKSLGLQIVTALTGQIRGTFELNGAPGTTAIIRFEELTYKDRG